MNWEAVGAVGEVVGAVAVVATLLYLAIQIRQSTNQARAAAQRDVNSAFQAAIDRFGTNIEIFQLGCMEFENLSRSEQLTFDFMIAPLTVHLDQVIRMYKQGLETEDNVQTYGDVLLAILQAPGAKIWYDQVRPFAGAEVRAYLEHRFNDESTLPPAFVDILPWHRPDSTPKGTPESKGFNAT
jgi:hypothetical protein